MRYTVGLFVVAAALLAAAAWINDTGTTSPRNEIAATARDKAVDDAVAVPAVRRCPTSPRAEDLPCLLYSSTWGDRRLPRSTNFTFSDGGTCKGSLCAALQTIELRHEPTNSWLGPVLDRLRSERANADTQRHGTARDKPPTSDPCHWEGWSWVCAAHGW